MLIAAIILLALGVVLVLTGVATAALAWTLYVGILLIIVAVPLVIVSIATRSRRRSAPGRGELSDRYDTIAIIAFVLSFFLYVPAVVLGHIALGRLNKSNERGWGLAVASLALGYAGIAITIIAVGLQLAVFGAI